MIAQPEPPTARTPPLAASFGKPKSTLLAIFTRQRRQSLIWFLVAVAAWVWAAWDRHALIEQLTRKREVVVIDSLGTYYVSPVVDIQRAKDVHALQTKLACKALFERNPEGLDNPELFKVLFLKEAAKTAQAAIDKTKPEFEAKSLHQKVETGVPEILSTRDNAFYTAVDVQLIRVGAFQNAPITEVLRYRVKFKFLLNPDLTRNGRFPTAVAAFQVEPVTRT
ncbi:hypothetical protein [Opitutus terrae]|uniref:Bacterial virulence protein VirB8 domain-containing protein n=1 Tax=Opitutus terrae (strain DSM 11246 / JCM 15787 / PB90-1) TaxID=452637 RepID=B1ZPH2_OPITP|nr:hypothetical protein [Opitutus terrae]ACB74491.1 hypothetical protein Oter_1205 [Opitutus terrae PB90-1]